MAAKVFLIGLLVYLGCDPVTIPPIGSGNGSLGWLQGMNQVSVSYSGNTCVHSHNGGVDLNTWFPREMLFTGMDSVYYLSWQDSQFTARSCFSFFQIDPIFGLSNDCSDQSLVRGIYHSSSNSVSDLVCLFKSYVPGGNQNSYRTQSASLTVPGMDFEAYSGDSIFFSVSVWKPGSVSVSYSFDEESYGNSKQMQLVAIDTMALQYQEICRLVFTHN